MFGSAIFAVSKPDIGIDVVLPAQCRLGFKNSFIRRIKGTEPREFTRDPEDKMMALLSNLFEIIFFFFLLTGTLPLYFIIISFCIQYLCVNLGHRSPRVMSWGTCIG